MDTTSPLHPRNLRKTVAFTCIDTSLGLLMVAATKDGICVAEFGDSEAMLRDRLEREFPAADLTGSASQHGTELAEWGSALQAHLDHGTPHPTLPLDLQGSEFQVNVWESLRKIREGEVVSYSELARRMGEPKAVRAVASACGRNRIAVLIPCHRVLRSDGSLGGYRWGLARKQQLLDRERLMASGKLSASAT